MKVSGCNEPLVGDLSKGISNVCWTMHWINYLALGLTKHGGQEVGVQGWKALVGTRGKRPKVLGIWCLVYRVRFSFRFWPICSPWFLMYYINPIISFRLHIMKFVLSPKPCKIVSPLSVGVANILLVNHVNSCVNRSLIVCFVSCIYHNTKWFPVTYKQIL